MLSFLVGILLFFLLLPTSFSANKFLTISDIHFGESDKFGEKHDTDQHLLQIAMDKLTELALDVDFIINLGDIPLHGNYSPLEKENYERTVFRALYQANTQAKPMFYVAGNNDSLAGNYQPFSQNGYSPLNLAEDWQGACNNCAHLIISDEFMYSRGFYSSFLIPGNHELILIALNSTQFMDLPAYYPQYPNQQDDALEQLDWLEQQLAQNHAKQLLIAMHEPPGLDYQGRPYWRTAYLQRFISLLKKNLHQYQQITLLTAHSHMDEIRKINIDSKNNIYAFSTPAISPIHFNNSAMKLFKLDDDLSLANFTTYYTESQNQWMDNYYTAIDSYKGIFPHCQGINLPSCLNSMNRDQVCTYIESGYFYGVKNLRVDNSECKKIYQIN